MYIVGFNGPPQCGKDTAAKFLADALDSCTDLPVKVVSIVDTLARMGAVLLGVEYSAEWYEDAKKTHYPILRGATLRQWMIEQTEEFHKPKYGASFWFSNLLMQHYGFHGILIISNIGFPYEVRLAEDESSSFMLIQLDREGVDWDSRVPVRAANTRHYLNNGSLFDLMGEMRRVALVLKDMWSL